MSGAMGGHQSHRAGTTTWLTPPHVHQALGQFDLDPCGHPDWPTAKHSICLPDDGLTAPWHGRVWLNPPYGSEAWQWLAKLAAHGTGTALLFLHGRLHFHHPDGTRAPANSGAPSVLAAYGDLDARRLANAPLSGSYIRIGGN